MVRILDGNSKTISFCYQFSSDLYQSQIGFLLSQKVTFSFMCAQHEKNYHILKVK